VDSRNSSVWRRGCRAVAQTLKHIFVFAFGSLYFLYILYCYYYSYPYMLDIICVLILAFNQESYRSTSTHNLEESWGKVLEPFTGNSDSILIIHCVLVKSFNSVLFVIRLALHLFTPSKYIFQMWDINNFATLSRLRKVAQSSSEMIPKDKSSAMVMLKLIHLLL